MSRRGEDDRRHHDGNRVFNGLPTITRTMPIIDARNAKILAAFGRVLSSKQKMHTKQ
jgi:hypothetical protein